MPSEVQRVFEALPGLFQRGTVARARTYYFALDEDEKWTVSLTPDACEVRPGPPAADADCTFQSSKQMFLDIWSGKYVPGAKDFLMGSIRSNNPLLLREFVTAFRKP